MSDAKKGEKSTEAATASSSSPAAHPSSSSSSTSAGAAGAAGASSPKPPVASSAAGGGAAPAAVEEDVEHKLAESLGLKYAVICLGLEKPEDLDRVLSEKKAKLIVDFSDLGTLKGPVRVRDVLLRFDKALCSIGGESDHVFVEDISVSEGTIYVMTGS